MSATVKRLVIGLAGRPLATVILTWVRWSGHPVGLALLYHRIGDPEGDPATELVPRMGTARLSAQLAWLAGHFEAVHGSELADRIRRRRRGERLPLAITFDDDVPEHLEFATAVLREHRAPGTFFLCGHALEGVRGQWWERLAHARSLGVLAEALSVTAFAEPARHAERIPASIHELAFALERLPPDELDAISARLLEVSGTEPPGAGMRTSEVRRLAALGHEVGFHTRRHDRMSALEDTRLAAAVRVGVDELETAAGAPLRSIAYPHGAVDSRVARAARAAGFDYGFTTRARAITAYDDPLLLPRIEPWAADPGGLASIARSVGGAARYARSQSELRAGGARRGRLRSLRRRPTG